MSHDYIDANKISPSAQSHLDNDNEEERRIYLVTDGLKSEATKETYNQAFSDFIKTTVKHNDLRALLDTKPNVIEGKVIKHIEYLRDVRKLTCGSIQVYTSGILHFFEMNDVSLNIKKLKRFFPAEKYDNYKDRPYSPREIQQILDKSDVRSRVVILLMVSTGMRIGAIPELRISDLKRMDEFNLYLIWVYNSSKKDRYYTFSTPECAQAIDAYLEYRKKCGENVKEHAPLIRNKISVDNPFTTATPRFVSERAIELMVEGLLKQAGLKQSRQQVMRSHGFRKFFINQMDRIKVYYPTRRYLAGHRLPGNDENYLRTPEEDRLIEYVKAINSLTISSECKLQQQVDELKSERLLTMDEYHKQWMEELQRDKYIVDKREWNDLVDSHHDMEGLLQREHERMNELIRDLRRDKQISF